MINIDGYKKQELVGEEGLMRLVLNDEEIQIEILSLSSVKKIKFEIEAFTKEGKKPLIQEHFFREKLRSINPNRNDHNLPSGILSALKYLKEDEEGWFELSGESQNNTTIGNYPVEVDPIFVRLKTLEIEFSMAVNQSDPWSYIVSAEIAKKKGNSKFIKEDFVHAIQEYVKANRVLSNLPKKINENFENKSAQNKFYTDLSKMKINILNNLSLSYIRTQNFPDAMQTAKEALDIDNNNEKSLYRMAKINEMEKDYQSAIEIYKKLGMKDKVAQLKIILKTQNQNFNNRIKQSFL
jgi:tetratricopeptide (TPR) repeat protein